MIFKQWRRHSLELFFLINENEEFWLTKLGDGGFSVILKAFNVNYLYWSRIILWSEKIRDHLFACDGFWNTAREFSVPTEETEFNVYIHGSLDPQCGRGSGLLTRDPWWRQWTKPWELIMGAYTIRSRLFLLLQITSVIRGESRVGKSYLAIILLKCSNCCP